MPQPLYWSLSLTALVLAVASTQPVAATSYSIVTQADDLANNNNCTLREALKAAETNLVVDLCPAGSASGVDTIALAAGTYPLPLGALSLSPDEEIRVHGPAANPPTAVISGGTSHRIVELASASARLTLEDLELREGNALATADPLGGAIRASASSLVARRVLFIANVARRGGAIGWHATGAARSLVIESCRFFSNEALNTEISEQAEGGALWLDPTDPATIRVVDSDFVGNRAASTLAGDFVAGGAILLVTEGSGASVRFERLRFIDNIAESTGAGGSAHGGALRGALNAAQLVMEDVEFSGNDLGLTPAAGFSAMWLSFSGASNSTLDRLRLESNGSASSMTQAFVSTHSQSIVRLRDGLIAGAENGLVAVITDGTLRLVHLTVADNAGDGLVLAEDAGSLVLENSIVYGNGTDIVVDKGTPTIAPENLVGVDPMFTDAAGGDYTLAAGSPAEDAGNTASTFLGPYDLAHAVRVVGAETDLGAFERGGIFNDGFEVGTAGAWSW